MPSCSEALAARLRNCCGTAILSLAGVSSLLLWASPTLAQVAGAESPTPQAHHAHRRPSLDDRVKILAKNLDMDEAQQTAVKKILEQRQQEILRLRTDPALSGEARIEQFRALQGTTVERIRAVLNEEQRKKYNPLAPRELKPAPDQRSVEDWLKLTTPQ